MVDFKEPNHSSHDPEVQTSLVKALKAKENMKLEGSTVGADRSAIMAHYYDKMDKDAKALFPDRRSVLKMVARQRPGAKIVTKKENDDVAVKDLGNFESLGCLEFCRLLNFNPFLIN